MAHFWEDKWFGICNTIKKNNISKIVASDKELNRAWGFRHNGKNWPEINIFYKLQFSNIYIVLKKHKALSNCTQG